MNVLRFAILGLATGGIYALMAQGLVITHRATGLVNFAQGATGMAGAYLFYSFWNNFGWPWPAALAATFSLSFAFGGVVHLVIMRPLRDASPLVRMIATLGLLTTLEYVFSHHYGSDTRLVASPLPAHVIHLTSQMALTTDRLIVVGIAVAVSLALWGFYRFTAFGLATTAVSENIQATAAVGLSPDRIAVINWGVGTALGTLGAIFIAPISGLHPVNLSLLILPAVAAALVGRFSSFTVTFATAMVLGVAQSEASEYTHVPGLPESLPFILVVMFLLLSGHSFPARSEVGSTLPSVGTGRIRLRALGPLAAAALALALTAPRNWQFALTTSLVFGFLALSLVVVVGYCGQLSLAQYMLAGVGAWIASESIAHLHLDFLAAGLLGVAGTIPLGLVVATPALRTRGMNLAIATLGLGAIVQNMVFANGDLTANGVGVQIGRVELFGVDVSPITHPSRFTVLALVLFAVCALAVANLRRGTTGRHLVAVRSNERAAASLGVSVFSAKLYAFSLSAAIAGLAGVLFAYQSTTVQFTPYQALNSVNAVLLATIGGIGHVIGTLWTLLLAPGGAGARVFLPLGDVNQWFQTYSGILLIVTLLVHPDGLAVRRSNSRGADPADSPQPESPSGNPDRAPTATAHGRPSSKRSRSALTVTGLTVRFGGVVALSDVSLQVRPGEIVGLIGPNGAGKTTLIDAVSGFVTPSAGRVELRGTDILNLSPTRRARMGLGRSFQSVELFEDLNVEENLRVGSDRRRRSAYVTDLLLPQHEQLSPIAADAVAEFDLSPDLTRSVRELSYGRRRLVGIVRSIAAEPAILLLDEPAAGLDEVEAAELGRLIVHLAQNWGLGILLVEHHVDLVMGISDYITVLNFGSQLAAGTPDAIRNSREVIAAYLGSDPSSSGPAIPDGIGQGATSSMVVP